MLFKLLGNILPSDKTAHDSTKVFRNRIDDYQSLLLKVRNLGSRKNKIVSNATRRIYEDLENI